jgi:hypothetical protein
MKKPPVYITILACLFFSLYSNALQAQLIKKIMNTVKNTAENRVNDKAAQSTNQVFDKVDNNTKTKSATTSTSTQEQGDTASANKVLGAFAQAAQQNPNDTSSADLTMKALGLLAGGGGVSAADSAAAIESFINAKGGSGYYFESITTTATKKGTSKDTSKIYMTSAGEGRSEMRINIPGAMSNQFINIGRATNPKYSVMLYPETKTYALNIIDTALINSNNETYEVTKLGNETIQGYNCTHVKLKSTFGKGIFKSSSIMDLWTSENVPGYSFIKKIMVSQNIKPQMLQALEKNNCGGYIVKMASSGKGYSIVMELIKTQTKSFPASLFVIPNGYAQTNENMIYHMMGSAKNK